MDIEIKTMEPNDVTSWDTYVSAHPGATLYHLSGWREVIQKSYGHETYYLMALREPEGSQLTAHSSQLSVENYGLSDGGYELDDNRVVGILPLVHLKHFLFDNSLISIPFFDLGGILAHDEETEKALLSQAVRLGRDLKVKKIELRHIEPLSSLAHGSQLKVQSSNHSPMSYATKSHKVRMILGLPESPEILMKSFKSKLRSQIKKPLKEGLFSRVGGPDLLDDFYEVFSINMRDLGSPVHSKHLIQNVLEEFPEKSRIVVVYKDTQPLACSMVVGFRDMLENPWASALRTYSGLSPNMLLYWTMLEYACDNGYRSFDFGRSSPDEGTYRFKEQWGTTPVPLHWHYFSIDGRPIDGGTSETSKFEKAVQYWQKLPVSITRIMGPMIRKHIGL